jgi:hypothetical protein
LTLDITQGDVEDLLRQLNLYARRAVPFAARNGVKGTAFAAQEEWRAQMRRRLTLRNKFTTRSVRVDLSGARGLDIDRMEAVTGSDADYIKRTELGGTLQSRGQYGYPVPTKEARISKSSKRVVSRPNLKRNIQLTKRNRGGTTAARNAAAIRRAKSSGNKFVFLDLESGRSGIFKVTGGKRKLSVRMVWDMSRQRKTVRTPATPTMKPTVRALKPAIPAIYAKALLEQLQRNTLFGYR